ncbi:MAG: hypothetical protein IJA35_04715 [Clostridia bacterium]|nr:hypothetical protein [Clostridia bacterium]
MPISFNFIPFAGGVKLKWLLNIVLTIPLGLGLPFVCKRLSFKKALLAGVLLG